jgi:Domain of unknown function (DUF3291)
LDGELNSCSVCLFVFFEETQMALLRCKGLLNTTSTCSFAPVGVLQKHRDVATSRQYGWRKNYNFLCTSSFHCHQETRNFHHRSGTVHGQHLTRNNNKDDDYDYDTNQPLYYLAHMNYARLKHEYDHPDMLEFVNAFVPINLLAKTSPGFVWAFDTPVDVDDTSWTEYVTKEREMVPLLRDDPMLMPQMSLWTDIESLRHFAFKSGHAMYYKRKREWFTDDVPAPYAVCWWFRNNKNSTQQGKHNITTSTLMYPTLYEAFERCERLRVDGPTEYAFDFASARKFPMPTT